MTFFLKTKATKVTVNEASTYYLLPTVHAILH